MNTQNEVPQAGRQSQVQEQLARMGNNLDRLEKVAHGLADRLSRVLINDGTGIAKSATAFPTDRITPPSPLCPLASDLESRNTNLSNLVEMLENIRGRVEV